MSSDGPILPSGDGHHERADLALIRRAAREGWDIDPEWKKKLPARMARIVADPNSKNREAIGAFQALRMAAADNFAQLTEAYKLENPQAAMSPINIGTINIAALAQVAADPNVYAEFARLAEKAHADP
jgi:hypothetical protein